MNTTIQMSPEGLERRLSKRHPTRIMSSSSPRPTPAPAPSLLTRLGEALSRLDGSYRNGIADGKTERPKLQIPGADDHYESALPSTMFDRSMARCHPVAACGSPAGVEADPDFP